MVSERKDQSINWINLDYNCWREIITSIARIIHDVTIVIPGFLVFGTIIEDKYYKIMI